jgi:CRP/FNR family transcriptional regulator, cyclic AMP receptor protein
LRSHHFLLAHTEAVAQTYGMWKRKDFTSSESDKPRSGFFSSGFYGATDEDAENPSRNFQPSTPGVLAPGERVASVNPARVSENVVKLAASIQASQEFDAMRLTLRLADWTIFAEHLQPFKVEVGQEVIRQGASELMVYIIESGILGVSREDVNGRVDLATVGAGSVIGEGAFFSRMPRNASVHAKTRSVLWGLSPMRYAELAHKHPSIALSFVIALGSVVTRRMSNQPKRVTVT